MTRTAIEARDGAALGFAQRARYLYRVHKARWRDQRVALRALIGAIRPGDVALDVGAHKGSFLYWLARAASPGTVLALEPQPELAAYLRAARRACALENVVVHEVAASDVAGRASLAIPGIGPAHGASLEPAVALRESVRRIDVPTATLDDLLAGIVGRVAAIKIDVEGHELAVLRGARRTLVEHGPLLVVEIEARHLTGHTVNDVLRHLDDLGYAGRFIRRGALADVADFDPARDQRAEGPRFWDAADYCCNFVFTRRR